MLMAMLLTVGSMAVAQERIQWMDIQEAEAACLKQPKKIFVDVYTDWCGWCKRMDQTTFADPEVARYMNENYYAVKFNAERMDTVRFQGYDFVYVPNPNGKKGVHQLAAAMLQNKMSYPSYVLFNEEMKLVQVIPGYQQTDSFLPILHFFGEDAYKTTSWNEFVEAYSKRDNNPEKQ
mgnify:CR=1 FL=1